MTENCRKRKVGLPQILGQAWVLNGTITTEMDRLHTNSDPGNEDNPFPKLAALLQAHWTGQCKGLDPKITKPINHLCFFCNLRSLMSRIPDSIDSTKVKIQDLALLQSKKMAATVLPSIAGSVK
jgi:hypothetical protein